MRPALLTETPQVQPLPPAVNSFSGHATAPHWMPAPAPERSPSPFTETPAPAVADSLELDAEAGLNLDGDPGPVVFLGLRAALLFNVGLAVLGLVAYESWSLLAH